MNIPYLLFGKAIRKGLANGSIRPKGFDGMEHAYIDPDGNAYWTWPDAGSLPLVRDNELWAIMSILEAGISSKHLDEAATAIETKFRAITGTKSEEKRSRYAADGIILTRELLLRSRTIIPQDALVALAAVLVARGDEDPRKLDRGIHAQKIAAFNKAIEAGDDFFLGAKPLKDIVSKAMTTIEGYMQLRVGWKAWKSHRQRVLDLTKGK